MVITCDDLIFNDFQMSNHGLVCGNGFDGAIESTDSMSLAPVATTVFTGRKSRNTYISQKYEEVNEFTIRFCKVDCGRDSSSVFGENELRFMNRLLTGKPGYSWLKIVNKTSAETDYYYRAMVSSIEYERLGKDVVGYDVTFMCDGGRAYSEEQTVYISARANTPFYLFSNSDDLYDYELPVITITAAAAGTLTLTNNTDSWQTKIKNMTAGEKLTIDSANEILKSSRTRQYILNDFEDLHWPRILPGKNEYVCNQNATIQFVYRASRKVGFVS